VENAHLSKELVTLITDMDLDCKISEFERKDFDLDALTNLFIELEFNALIKQLEGFGGSPIVEESKDDKNYNTITNIDELKLYFKTLSKSKLISFDLETDSVSPMQTALVGMSFSTAKDEGVYIPVQYGDKSKNNFGSDDLKIILDLAKPLLENPKIKKTGQNIKFNALVMKNHGINVEGIDFDTMLAAHLIKPEGRSYKMIT